MPTVEDLQEELLEERQAAHLAIKYAVNVERYNIMRLIRDAKDVPTAIAMIEATLEA